MKKNKGLIVGDTGICGRHLVSYLLQHPDWSVCGLSRGSGQHEHHHISADLTVPESLDEALRDHADITHVFYVGRSPDPDPAIECERNTQMMINVVESVERHSGSLRHVQVMQGMKWYGSHAGAYRTPAREDDARHPWPNFYYDQQDWLVERQPLSNWSWSALRPHQVVGFSDQYPHNIAAVLALYGAFCHEKGIALDFPGTPACYNSISMVTCAQLLAHAMLFTATTKATENNAFNMGNGDYFRWVNVWPKIAEFFDVPCGDVREHSLDEVYGDETDVWEDMCSRYGLKNTDMSSIGSWVYGDFTFRAGWDDLASFTNLYEAGFTRWNDSERVLLDTLQHYRDAKIIP